MSKDTTRRLAAEFFGTFWLVFGGCGSAVLAAAFPELGIGFVGVSLAFGLTVLTMAYAVGHISGGHFNPAVTVGLWSAGRCANQHVVPYIVAQVIAAIAAAGVLWLIASGQPGWTPGGFAANGYGDLSPGKYGLVSCLLIEALLTFFFVLIIVGTTSKGAAVGFAGIPIGLALALIHLISSSSGCSGSRRSSAPCWVVSWPAACTSRPTWLRRRWSRSARRSHASHRLARGLSRT